MTKDQELTERQENLLRLIVREHVRTAEPVASGTVVQNYNLGVSSATVRNEMARLEEMGYLFQPHTSAGRIPTESGFRYFVGRLMDEQALSPIEQRMIVHQFYQAQDDIEAWMPLAASVMAQTAKGAAVVTAPRSERAIYKHLELIATHGRAVLLVLVLRGGIVEQRMLALPEPLTQQDLSEVADRLNQLCSGLTAAEIRKRSPELPQMESFILRMLLSLMEKTESLPADEIYRHGVPQLLEQPEFAEQEGTGLIRVLEETSQLRAVIADALDPVEGVGNIRVIIGGEGRWSALRMCSLVVTRYGVADYATGALGVLGPIRMAYGRTISVVRFVAGVLNEMVYEMYRPLVVERPSTEGDHIESVAA
ncbi:MAG: heat-inducible transcriptional repressor HrcA [Anaerolineae bacterium]